MIKTILKILLLPLFIVKSIVKNTKLALNDRKVKTHVFTMPVLFFIVASVISDVVDVVSEWAVAFWGLIIESINSAIALVYDPTGLTLAERITFIGYLALFGLAIGIVKLGMAFVMKFFKK
jgi:diacylglycerol kinase